MIYDNVWSCWVEANLCMLFTVCLYLYIVNSSPPQLSACPKVGYVVYLCVFNCWGDICRFINDHHLNFLFIIGNTIGRHIFSWRKFDYFPSTHKNKQISRKKNNETKSKNIQERQTNKQKPTLLPNQLPNLITSSKSYRVGHVMVGNVPLLYILITWVNVNPNIVRSLPRWDQWYMNIIEWHTVYTDKNRNDVK